jgi:hypothetical protein
VDRIGRVSSAPFDVEGLPRRSEIPAEFAHLYTQIKFSAAACGDSVVSHLPGTPFYVRRMRTRIACSEAFECAAMRQLILEYQENLTAVEHTIALAQLERDVIEYRGCIERTRARLLDHFAGLYLTEKMNAEKVRVERAGKNFSQHDFLIRNVDRQLLFHSWVAILNLMDARDLPNVRSLQRLADSFRKHMQTVVVPRANSWGKRNPAIAAGLQRVRHALQRSGRANFGTRLRAYVEMIELIATVEKTRQRKTALEWQDLFEYVIAVGFKNS